MTIMRHGFMLKACALALAIGMMAVVPSTVMAAGNGNGGGNGNGSDQDGGDHSGYVNGNGDQISEEKKERIAKETAKHRFFGRFNMTDGVVDGRFVAFELDEATGNVTDYALKNSTGAVTVFGSIQIQGFAPDEFRLQGSVMHISNATVHAIVHDNPTGMFHVVANGTGVNVSFLLAPGMSAAVLPSDEEDDCNRTVVAVAGQGIWAILATDEGDVALDHGEDGTYVNFTISNDHVMFRARPAFAHSHMHGSPLLEAISEGRVAGEMSLMLMEGVASYDAMQYRDGFEMRLLTAERDRLRIQVQSEEHAGKVVVIATDQGTFDASKGELRVSIDGAPVRMTSDPLEVLYAEGSEASDAVSCVLTSDGVSQVLVYVPSFSVHEISLESVGPLDALLTIGGIMALLGAVALVAVAGVTLLRRRR